MKRYITKYTENGKLYAEAWDQINIFGKTYTFHRRRIEIPVTVKHGRWIPINDQVAKCSLCGMLETTHGKDKTGQALQALIHKAVKHYCPNCGARMMDEEE